ncbi:hypothetical protein AAG570_008500 [Ranatra chinensis]|uniref:Uncharacterized protein n=1 Tax=Ranatra chinensis TaxID=642074 RepID=A0ABD0YR52_9HEMI
MAISRNGFGQLTQSERRQATVNIKLLAEMKPSTTLAVGLAVCMALTLAVEQEGFHSGGTIRDVEKIQQTDGIQSSNFGDLIESETRIHESEDLDLEDQPPRRTRPRGGGKRRRRMRKRPRTTTEQPSPIDESFEGTHYQEQHFEPQYNRPRRLHASESSAGEEVLLPRRRPIKRRRRPLRRYQERQRADYPGEDRIRDLGEDEVEPIRKRRKGSRKRPRIPIVQVNEETTTITHIDDSNQETTTHDSIPETSSERVTTDLGHTDETVTIISTISETNFESIATTVESVYEQDFDLNKTDLSQTQTQTTVTPVVVFEPKQKIENEVIFDRKTMFPTSKHLPPTSALLRRMLRPKSKHTDSNSDTHNEIDPSSLLPQGYTVSPEVISADELVNVWRSRMKVHETTEEPNYPKILPELLRLIKSKKNLNGNIPAPEASTEENKSEETTVQQRLEETLKYKALDIPNVKDDILDLLKSNSGSSRLARILKLRNMTLVELIAHRERGSSQLHLSEIFKKENENSQHQEIRPTIEFPKDEILGSFPKFFLQQINKSQENKTEKSEENVTAKSELRESRAFKATESTDKILKIQPYPTWKVIPNPKLTPVSVQGQYEEIYLTKFRPTPPHEINEVTLPKVDSPRSYTKNDITAESVRTRSPPLMTTLRRIAPGMKSAIMVSGAILVLAIFGFLSVLISCKVRQRRARVRAKRDVLCQHLQNDEFMNSQRSLSPVLTKTQREPVFTQGIHSNTTSNRHYYLWRTLRKTFQYD